MQHVDAAGIRAAELLYRQMEPFPAAEFHISCSM
jgi:hypothetical protein